MEVLIDLVITFWQWIVVIIFILIGFVINSFEKKGEKRVHFKYSEMPKMIPVPIITRNKGFGGVF